MSNTRIRKRQLSEDAIALDTVAIAFGASPYTVISETELIFADSTLGAIEILLPSIASTNAGRRISVRDQMGTAAIYTITLTPAGSDTIEGEVELVMDTTKDAVTLESNGLSDWAVIARN